MKTTRIIGVMSGTSLDGVDIAWCTFSENENGYSYQLGVCETVPYSDHWLSRLKSLPSATALEYAETHVAYGNHLGMLISDFCKRNKLETDYVASHGHTIFHNPAKHYTCQIGEGAAIAEACGLPVVCDFRTGDVAAGGQGAPLVPIGDEFLFSQFDYCLNLGGFANISMRSEGQRIAFDISPANIILNHIAGKTGKSYDRGGALAASGKVNDELLLTLNEKAYYKLTPPKSLGREWIEKEILPVLNLYNISPADSACTFCEHIAVQITACLVNDATKQMLITGGGAFNTYLLQRIAAHTNVKLIIPDNETVNFKEALVFAFLGLLRMEGKPNCLAPVTGAMYNVSGGAIYKP